MELGEGNRDLGEGAGNLGWGQERELEYLNWRWKEKPLGSLRRECGGGGQRRNQDSELGMGDGWEGEGIGRNKLGMNMREK